MDLPGGEIKVERPGRKLKRYTRLFKVKGKRKRKNIFLETGGPFSHWLPALPQQASDVPDVLVPHIN